MGGSRYRQQALAAGQDQVDTQRERVRASGQLMDDALRQLWRDHALVGDPAPVRRNMRPPLRLDTCKISVALVSGATALPSLRALSCSWLICSSATANTA
jgi:hypothetical protein